MHLFYIFLAIIVVGLVTTVAGLAPVGIVLLVLGAAGLAYAYLAKAMGQRRNAADGPPADDGRGHKVTGFAHEGQKHMGE